MVPHTTLIKRLAYRQVHLSGMQPHCWILLVVDDDPPPLKITAPRNAPWHLPWSMAWPTPHSLSSTNPAAVAAMACGWCELEHVTFFQTWYWNAGDLTSRILIYNELIHIIYIYIIIYIVIS